MLDVLIVCVIYSTALNLTKTYSSLRNIDYEKIGVKPTVAIWDNSANGYDLSVLKSDFDDYYTYHSGNNEKLSFVYNTVISDLIYLKHDWVVILDDDSEVDESYFLELINANHASSKLALPKIYHMNTLISPGVIKGVRGFQLSSIETGIQDFKNGLVGMMSGTAISHELLTLIKFDEKLGFYGVDTKFYLDASKFISSIFIMNYSLVHDSSLRNKEGNYFCMRKRFEDLLLSRIYIFNKIPYFRFKLACYFFAFSIKKSIHLRDFRYLSLIKLIFKI